MNLVPDGGILIDGETSYELCKEQNGGQKYINGTEKASGPLVSIIMPVYNAALFLEDMLASLLHQSYAGSMELLVFDDGPSTDSSMDLIEGQRDALRARNITLQIFRAPSGAGPRGCGYGRNTLIGRSSGQYLCFADADDIMLPDRIEAQMHVACRSKNVLVGSRFVRSPADATPRYTAWANGLSQVQLYLQQMLETTIITPTWLCSRAVFDRAGPFDESGPGTPDDLDFFYRHLACGGLLAKVEQPLVIYRFHSASVTGQRSVPWQRIWAVRVAHLQAQLLNLSPWTGGFTLWNAGKEGRRLFASLAPKIQSQVLAFCDIDPKKMERGVRQQSSGRLVPVVHWSEAVPPLLLCVKRGLTQGAFEANVNSLKLQEGIDYVYFS